MKLLKFRSFVPWVVLVVVLGAAAMVRQANDWTFRYAVLRPTDDALREWLAERTRMGATEISRDQAGVHVHQSDPLWMALWQGGFPIQDFMAACERAGYKDFGGFQGTSHLTWRRP